MLTIFSKTKTVKIKKKMFKKSHSFLKSQKLQKFLTKIIKIYYKDAKICTFTKNQSYVRIYTKPITLLQTNFA